MTEVKQAQAKRYVKGPHKDGRLVVNTVGGEPWASNTYWLVPSATLRSLFEHFNLDHAEPAVYQVDGKVTPMPGSPPPAIASLFPDLDETVVLERVTVVGRPVLVQLGNALCELWQRPDGGDHVALNRDYAELCRTAAGSVPAELRQHRDMHEGVVAFHTEEGARALLMPVRMT